MKHETRTPNGTEPLTVEEAAEALGVSIHTVRAWLGRRKLGHLKLGRSVRVPREEVERLLRDSFVPAVAERAR